MKASNSEDARVLIAYGVRQSADYGAGPSGRSFTLPHPRTGQPAAYLLLGGVLQEVNCYKPHHAAWFAGNYVISDGTAYLATPVDPLLVLLPVLEAARDQAGLFREQGEILQSSGVAALPLLQDVAAPHVDCICDVKQAEGQRYLRLSDARVLAWLSCKVERTASALAASTSHAGMDAAALMQYSIGLVGEYLPAVWQQRLAAQCGSPGQSAAVAVVSPLQPVPNGQQPGAEERRPDKRPRYDPKEVAKRRAAEVKAEAKAAQLAKQTAGMKKMSSFFSCQPKS